MRTTIRIDENLLKEAKRTAAETGVSLTSVIEDALRERLSRRPEKPRRRRVRLPTFTGKGPLPGIDLDDSAGLLERMEGPPAAS